MLSRSIIAIFFSVLLWGVWGKSSRNVPEPPVNPPYLSIDTPWADSLMQVMTLEEKIGQLFMVAANGRDTDESDYQLIDSLIENYDLGGLIYFQSHPTEHVSLVNRFQSKSKIPLMNGIDGEWGMAMRIDSMMAFPWNMTLGAIQNDTLLFDLGKALAKESKAMGIHVNFAPVVDVNSNPLNPIINARSYGELPENVAQKGKALMLGMQYGGVLACAKHFPGHGDTGSDSHKTLPVIYHDKARIDSVDIIPFKSLIDAGVASVMVAHLDIPALDSTTNRASTLSPYIVDTLLQQDLNFKGLIFTDALNMKSVSAYYESGALEVSALQAGNDVLLFPEDVPAAVQAIKIAISDSLLTEDRINASCHKILKAKEWMGIHRNALVNDVSVRENAQDQHTLYLKRRLEEAALTLIKSEDNILPIIELKDRKLAVLTLGEASGEAFVKQLNRYAKVVVFNPEEDLAMDVDVLFISVHRSNKSPWKSYKFSEDEKILISRLSQQTKVVLTVFANPYSLLNAEFMDDLDGMLMAYQNSESMQSLAAQALFGALDISGELPVSISDKYAAGWGIKQASIGRLKYTMPEELGMNGDSLAFIDSIANYAISIKATPGCQVLVAKQGKVVYHKSFGYHTYDSLRAVDEFDVYDIASITKIASTVPLLMQKVDEGNFDLDRHLIDYLSMEDTCSKAHKTTREILSHQAQLWPWIPFYEETLTEKGGPNPKVYQSSMDETYELQVARDIYMNRSYSDTVLDRVLHSKMRKEKGYKYSDLGYYLLKEIIERQEGASLKDLVQNRIYKDLGANYTSYHPLEVFPKEQIVPTEKDEYFRKQLLQGYVHDPGAAMQNGVGGHAGIFSNANDLAKLMQMYLNGGTYAGKEYIKQKTLQEFTSCQYCKKDNRRGIGFDKPVIDDTEGPTCLEASPSSFGHSGFTGTIVWADPEHELIYVFLSNRIHPSADNSLLVKENIRTRIQEVIYKAIE